MTVDPTDATLVETPGGPPELTERPSQPPGFELREIIGEGGMGEVRVAEEQLVGRDVAIKRLRGKATPEAIARFLREARIQARLEHPSIVPVYQVGIDSDGLPFFAMKRLEGRTFAAALDDADVREHTLLRAFVAVCQAIELAHSRGVVHRDLKPPNIMLGDLGEVYVLDWGIARLVTDAEEPARVAIPSSALDTPTQTGALLGTPGYMAPEQVRGEVVGAAADVYALGAILYEILARTPLHSRGAAALEDTLTHPTRAPSALRLDVAPELDGLCVAALAETPAARPSARELADRIQQYLDGDRDLERRKLLAREALVQARRALDDDDRAGAMRAAGRALALDPESGAAALVSKLMLEPPVRHPPELAAHLASVEQASARDQWQKVGFAWLSFVAFVPILFWAGVQQVDIVLGLGAWTGVLAAIAFVWHKRGRPAEIPYLLAGCAAIVAMTRLVGPFVVVPVIMVIQIVGYMSYPSLAAKRQRPVFVLAISAATVLVPLALEYLGLFSETWALEGDHYALRSSALVVGARTTVLLVVSHAAMIVVAGLFAWSLASARYAAQRQLEIQAWHLRKLIPT